MSYRNNNDGCSCLFFFIIAIAFVPSLFKGCVSCVDSTSKSINRWQENRARESANDQQESLRKKTLGKPVDNPCPSCNGTGAYSVDCTNEFHYRSDCKKCMRREKGIHYHKCLTCYGTGYRRD